MASRSAEAAAAEAATPASVFASAPTTKTKTMARKPPPIPSGEQAWRDASAMPSKQASRKSSVWMRPQDRSQTAKSAAAAAAGGEDVVDADLWDTNVAAFLQETSRWISATSAASAASGPSSHHEPDSSPIERLEELDQSRSSSDRTRTRSRGQSFSRMYPLSPEAHNNRPLSPPSTIASSQGIFSSPPFIDSLSLSDAASSVTGSSSHPNSFDIPRLSLSKSRAHKDTFLSIDASGNEIDNLTPRCEHNGEGGFQAVDAATGNRQPKSSFKRESDSSYSNWLDFSESRPPTTLLFPNEPGPYGYVTTPVFLSSDRGMSTSRATSGATPHAGTSRLSDRADGRMIDARTSQDSQTRQVPSLPWQEPRDQSSKSASQTGFSYLAPANKHANSAQSVPHAKAEHGEEQPAGFASSQPGHGAQGHVAPDESFGRAAGSAAANVTSAKLSLEKPGHEAGLTLGAPEISHRSTSAPHLRSGEHPADTKAAAIASADSVSSSSPSTYKILTGLRKAVKRDRSDSKAKTPDVSLFPQDSSNFSARKISSEEPPARPARLPSLQIDDIDSNPIAHQSPTSNLSLRSPMPPPAPLYLPDVFGASEEVKNWGAYPHTAPLQQHARFSSEERTSEDRREEEEEWIDSLSIPAASSPHARSLSGNNVPLRKGSVAPARQFSDRWDGSASNRRPSTSLARLATPKSPARERMVSGESLMSAISLSRWRRGSSASRSNSGIQHVSHDTAKRVTGSFEGPLLLPQGIQRLDSPGWRSRSDSLAGTLTDASSPSTASLASPSPFQATRATRPPRPPPLDSAKIAARGFDAAPLSPYSAASPSSRHSPAVKLPYDRQRSVMMAPQWSNSNPFGVTEGEQPAADEVPIPWTAGPAEDSFRRARADSVPYRGPQMLPRERTQSTADAFSVPRRVTPSKLRNVEHSEAGPTQLSAAPRRRGSASALSTKATSSSAPPLPTQFPSGIAYTPSNPSVPLPRTSQESQQRRPSKAPHPSHPGYQALPSPRAAKKGIPPVRESLSNASDAYDSENSSAGRGSPMPTRAQHIVSTAGRNKILTPKDIRGSPRRVVSGKTTLTPLRALQLHPEVGRTSLDSNQSVSPVSPSSSMRYPASLLSDSVDSHHTRSSYDPASNPPSPFGKTFGSRVKSGAGPVQPRRPSQPGLLGRPSSSGEASVVEQRRPSTTAARIGVPPKSPARMRVEPEASAAFQAIPRPSGSSAVQAAAPSSPVRSKANVSLPESPVQRSIPPSLSALISPCDAPRLATTSVPSSPTSPVSSARRTSTPKSLTRANKPKRISNLPPPPMFDPASTASVKLDDSLPLSAQPRTQQLLQTQLLLTRPTHPGLQRAPSSASTIQLKGSQGWDDSPEGSPALSHSGRGKRGSDNTIDGQGYYYDPPPGVDDEARRSQSETRAHADADAHATTMHQPLPVEAVKT